MREEVRDEMEGGGEVGDFVIAQKCQIPPLPSSLPPPRHHIIVHIISP